MSDSMVSNGTFVALRAAAASDSPVDEKSTAVYIARRSARNTAGVPPLRWSRFLRQAAKVDLHDEEDDPP